MENIYLKNIKWNSLPREAKIAFIIYQQNDESNNNNIALGYCVLQLIDAIGHLVNGEHKLGLWSFNDIQIKENYVNNMQLNEFIFRSTNCCNKQIDSMYSVLTIHFDKFTLPVAAPCYLNDIVSYVSYIFFFKNENK